MKKIRIAAMAAVLILGIGGAVIASNNADPLPNVQNNNPDIYGPPDWQPLTPTHRGCDNANLRPCLGYKETPSSIVIPQEWGSENP